MCAVPSRLRIRRGWVIGAFLALGLGPRAAHAWLIGSPLDPTGCHEPITAAALRAVRARFDTAPPLAPSRDEAAMIADVAFAPPGDFVHDLAGMTLLLGVRDNDLKGVDPLSSLDLVQVEGNPTTQDEHCTRSPDDDGAAGNQSALAACHDFIVNTATEALDGLDAAGRVDPTRRTAFQLAAAIRGEIAPALPVFYVKIGAALHALEDSFPHTYRTGDGTKVTAVLNGIDLVSGHYDEARDGPGHRPELDRCADAADPIIHRNYQLAIQAATDLLAAAVDPGLDRAQKIRQFDAVTATYLGYQPGCTFANHWCDAPEAKVTNSIACDASGGGALAPRITLALALVLAGLVVRRRRRARRGRRLGPGAAGGAALLLAVGLAASARADAPLSLPPSPSPSPSPSPPPPPPPTTDAGNRTPAAQALAESQLDSPWGFTAAVGGSIDRPALVTSIGLRYRIRELWIAGIDAGWNPWVTTSPRAVRAGVATLAGTLIRRFPLRAGRIHLRSSVHLGASTLLFDLYGAPKYSTGLYGAVSLLGLDCPLGHGVRLVWDPIEIALPVPLLGQVPLYYEQFRFMVGIQVGS